MTFLPHDHRHVRGVKDYAYTPEQQCSHPFCVDTVGLQRHHCWPRSFLRGQPTEWVMAPYGVQVGNVVLLCLEHHQEITENKAKILWGEDRQFFWLDDQVGLPLNPHPPVSPGVPAASGAKSSPSHREWAAACGWCKGYPDQAPDSNCPFEHEHEVSGAKSPPIVHIHPNIGPVQVFQEFSAATESHSKREDSEHNPGHGEAHSSGLDGLTEPHRAIPEGEECPTCKRRVPKKKKEASKNRVTYSIRVPKDKRENGVELLEDMVAQVETMLGHESARPAYYTLIDALGLMLLNPEILG